MGCVMGCYLIITVVEEIAKGLITGGVLNSRTENVGVGISATA